MGIVMCAGLGSTEDAREIANELSDRANDLNGYCESLESILTGLAQNWSTTQVDQQNCVKKLRSNMEMLKKVSSASSKFSEVINDYASKLEVASSKTVS